MKVVGIIPARYESTRLPGKPLADILGKPMVRWVYEAAARSKLLDRVIVATDDERVRDAAVAFGADVVMTPSALPTGTDRVAAVARDLDVDVIVNVQGDEPFLDPAIIDEVVAVLPEDPLLHMSTAMHELTSPGDFENPGVVKVVVDLAGDALYFSRSLIPFPRNRGRIRVFEHIGLYAYSRDFLLSFAAWPQTPLEMVESLEQLRVLEHGERLRVVETASRYVALSVDTPEDLEAARSHARRITGGCA